MQRGSLKVVRNRKGVKVWRAQWRENGTGRTRILGRYADLTRAEARAALDKILEPLREGKGASSATHSAVTLRRFVEDDYLIVQNRRWKESTRATTEQIIETHILAPFGNRVLASITRRELQAHLDSKATAGLSSSLVGHIRWQLAAIFKMALADGLILVNPAEGLVMPKCAATPSKRIIAVADIQRAQMVLPIRERLIFRLAVCEGMRPGEITGLQVGDIQADGIHIERRVYRGKIDSPKSKRSRRIVPPTAATRDLLAEYMEFLIDKRKEAWLFPSEAGNTPLSYSNVYRRRISKALRAIGLEGVNFQVLRRTWVTEFSEVEPDPNIRARLAGHSVDVHENEYRQANPTALERAMRRLDRHLR